jgi:hypothetical protein
MSDDAKLDELFRAGLKTASRPYARAAVVHRDAMLSPAPKETMRTRVRDRGAGFASAHGRLIAALAAAAALTGAAAYAVPNLQSASKAKVGPTPNQTTVPYATQPSVPGRANRAGDTPGNGTPDPGNSNVIVPPGYVPPVGYGSGTQTGGTTGTQTGTQAGGGGGNTGPTGPPDNPAPPHYNTENAVQAVLHDGNVLTVSAQNDPGNLDQWVNEGPVEIGFQDARTQPAPVAAVLWLPSVADQHGAALTQPVAIPAGTTQVLHLVYMNNAYALTAHVGSAVVNGDFSFWLHAVAAPDVNRNNPYVVKTALDAGGFELGGTPALHQGDEPCTTNDPYKPTSSDAWVALGLLPQKSPYLNITNNDGGTWVLTIVGYTGRLGNGRFPAGDIHPGKTAKFTLPPHSEAAVYGKWVLQYSNGSLTRTIVIWRDVKGG